MRSKAGRSPTGWRRWTLHHAFGPGDTAFIGKARFFFLATADPSGQPDVSFKGGAPGFVQVTGGSELAFPDYDGNGMFKSLGNIAVNAKVGLLFIDFETPRRLRIAGEASIRRDDPLLAAIPGAQMIVRVKAAAIFPNCPRYIPTMTFDAPSPYVPEADHKPREPAWKSFDEFRDAVPRRHDGSGGERG